MNRFKKRDSPQKIVSKIAEETHKILQKILDISPPMKVHLLNESEWNEKFQGQAYGDPVAPGDGEIYYGHDVPKYWLHHFADFSKDNPQYEDVVSSDSIPIFYCTASHEVGHLFSNQLCTRDTLNHIDDDFSNASFDNLWFLEFFSQYSMALFMHETNHKYRDLWLDFYRWYYDEKRRKMKFQRMEDWGTGLLRYMREDAENALNNYIWFQAKSYLLCEEILEELGEESFLGLGSAIKFMPYPLTTPKLAQHIDDYVPGFSKIWTKWNGKK